MNLIGKIREKLIQRVQYLKRTYVYGDYVFVSFPKSGRTWVRLMLEDLGVSLKYDHAGSRHAGDALHMDDLPDPLGWKGKKNHLHAPLPQGHHRFRLLPGAAQDRAAL